MAIGGTNTGPCGGLWLELPLVLHPVSFVYGKKMSPIEQFKIHTLIPLHVFGYDISVTNATVVMLIACALCIGLPYLALIRRGRLLSLLELSFELVTDTMQQYAHDVRYFPFIFSIFIFVLLANMIGIIPHVHTSTSHVIVTFTMACIVYGSILIIGLIQKGWHFFHMFLPSSIPLYLAPLFIPIEIISFLSKPFSLAIRLFANMTAGHIVLKIFAGFVVSMIGLNWFMKPFAVIPLAVSIVMICFEIAVAFIQAYVFTILSCVYINEMLGDSH